MMSFIQNEPFTAHFLAADSIKLTSEQIDWAIALSEKTPNLNDQWACYIHTLALLGVQNWLKKQLPNLPIHSEWLPADPFTVSYLSPQSHLISRVKAGPVKLYLLPIGCVEVPLLSMPMIKPQNGSVNADMPDIYVLVEVLEEISEVRVCGYLSQDEAVPVRQSATELLLSTQQFIEDPEALAAKIAELSGIGRFTGN